MENKPTLNKDGQQDNTYRTGNTEPPKNRRGLFAFLLGFVIFFGGVVTILNKMNIQLVKRLTEEQEPEMCTVAFAPAAPQEAQLPVISPLGFSGQPVPPFWQEYHSLPQGIYITQVNPQLQLLPGDILLTANGHPISCWEELETLVAGTSSGQSFHVTVYRQGNRFDCNLIIP